MIRKHFTKSKAVLASSPLVELSQHCTRARVAIISAMLTRFRSPPLIPGTNASPTRVELVCLMLSMRRRVLSTVELNSERVMPGRRPGVLVDNAKERVCATVRVAM
jgi:hypothetical protein